MKSFTKMFYFPLLFLTIFSTNIFATGHNTAYENPFSIVYGGAGTNIYGDYVSTASSVQCIQKNDGTCNNNYTGNLYDATTRYVNSVATSVIPLNSSTETLSLPSDINGSDILFAGLYWQGHIADVDADNYTTGIVGRNIVTMKDATANVHTLTADKIWYHDFWGNGTGNGGGFRSFYQGYKNVTTILKNSYRQGLINNYSVGNIKSSIGLDNYQYFWTVDAAYNGIRMGFYGNWNLVVVYQHPNLALLTPSPKPKNITIFQGFDALVPLPVNTAARTKSIEISLSGFLTPSQTPIAARMQFYGSGGEKTLHYDTLEIQDKKTTNFISLSNAANPVDDAFNGSLSKLGVPVDNTINYYPGLDSDDFNISIAMDTKQTSTKLRLTAKFIGNSGDQFFPGLISFSTDIFEPVFCYDYAYKQQGNYFTEDNNGTADPKLSTDNLPSQAIIGEPINMSIYIRNQVDSDIAVTDMNVNILDMNTSQVTYIRNSTELAKIGQLTPQPIPDTLLTVSDSFIKGVPVGKVGAQEYFYTYYQLNPLKDTLDMPIDVEVKYNLVAGGTTIPYTTKLGGSKIQMCSGGNFNYAPARGIFNIVHDDYYNLDTVGGTNPYYNLPTQVASREGSFKVISMDPNNLDTLKGTTSAVAVEMIDASAYHDTNASCNELTSSISKRVWVIFDNNTTSVTFNKAAMDTAITNGMTSLASSDEFYKTARANAAFRVAYNIVDKNGTLIDLDTSAGVYNISNIDFTVNGGKCSDTTTDITAACTVDMSKAGLGTCMECLYGIQTKLVCSRDNFSIRPEAFMIQLDDQNQTNSVQPQTDITTVLNSGSAGAIWPQVGQRPQVDLSAGYEYNIEVNATNHLNNTSTAGYTKTFNITSADLAQYTWNPRSITIANANLYCNDRNESNITIRLVNGKAADVNTSVDQVGEYRLRVLDTTWTKVDSDPAYMTHHTGSYFVSGLDCVANSSDTLNVGVTGLNGCDISSSHSNNEANLKYNDYNVTFHPYKFDITQNITMGLKNRDFNTTNKSANFVYMSDIFAKPKDVNMSVQVESNITAMSYDNVRLTNFVSKCYAQPLGITIRKSPTFDKTLDYKFIFQDINNTENNVSGMIGNAFINGNANLDKNITFTTTPTTLTATNGFFLKDDNGTLYSYTAINFDRNQSLVANPEDINYTDINVTDMNHGFYADLNPDHNTTAESNVTIGRQITHYYGRTAAKKTKIICTAGDTNCSSGVNGEPDVLIYYEVYCYGDTNGSICNKALLPLDSVTNNPVQKVDSRWYVNMYHKEVNDGNLTLTVEENGINRVTAPTNHNKNDYTKDSIHHYNTNNGLPYNGFMEDTIPDWLLYDENNATALKNKHLVIYKLETQWSGEHENNTTTVTDKVRRINRRTMW